MVTGQSRDARRLRELEAENRALRKQIDEKNEIINVQKIHRHTFQAIEQKYRYIRTARTGASVALLCRLLEVSRSGYYEWLHREPSVRKRAYKAAANSKHSHPIALNLLISKFYFSNTVRRPAAPPC